MLESIIQRYLRIRMLIFEHVESANIIVVGDHIGHASGLMQFSSFDRPDQVFAQSQYIQSEIHAKQFIDDAQYPCLFAAHAIKRSSRLIFRSIVECFGIRILQNWDCLLQFGLLLLHTGVVTSKS